MAGAKFAPVGGKEMPVASPLPQFFAVPSGTSNFPNSGCRDAQHPSFLYKVEPCNSEAPCDGIALIFVVCTVTPTIYQKPGVLSNVRKGLFIFGFPLINFRVIARKEYFGNGVFFTFMH